MLFSRSNFKLHCSKCLQAAVTYQTDLMNLGSSLASESCLVPQEIVTCSGVSQVTLQPSHSPEAPRLTIHTVNCRHPLLSVQELGTEILLEETAKQLWFGSSA